MLTTASNLFQCGVPHLIWRTRVCHPGFTHRLKLLSINVFHRAFAARLKTLRLADYIRCSVVHKVPGQRTGPGGDVAGTEKHLRFDERRGREKT
ncbi:MAG: hypothetical protein JWR61_1333 [Ferruginibacter sp.]|nr:hypothetical protein [Ferruginibacter sp.]